MAKIWGIDVEPQVGHFVYPDGWNGISGVLKPGLEGFCPFYITTNSNGPIKELACRIEITGRTWQRRGGISVVRCKITFVGDCEPDVICGGYICV